VNSRCKVTLRLCGVCVTWV